MAATATPTPTPIEAEIARLRKVVDEQYRTGQLCASDMALYRGHRLDMAIATEVTRRPRNAGGLR